MRASEPPGPSSSNATSATLNRTPNNAPEEEEESEEQLMEQLEREQRQLRIAELKLQLRQTQTQLLRLSAEGGQPEHAGASGTTLDQVTLIGGEPRQPAGVMVKPKDPHVFAGKGRSDFNQWVRDIERNFNRAPLYYNSELRKTDFAADWMGKYQQDKWERHLKYSTVGTPSWVEMKEEMLKTMGSADERRRAAQNRLRNIEQGSRTPTKVLDEMKECWDELEEDRQDRMILDFFGALSVNLQARLSNNPEPCRTIEEAEDRANEQHRIWKAQATWRDRKRTQSSATTDKAGRFEGGKRPTTRQSPPSEGKKGRSSPVGGKATDLSQIECYGCGLKGHKKPFCPNKHLWKEDLGKALPTLHSSSA
jgi:hypothetical protein